MRGCSDVGASSVVDEEEDEDEDEDEEGEKEDEEGTDRAGWRAAGAEPDVSNRNKSEPSGCSSPTGPSADSPSAAARAHTGDDDVDDDDDDDDSADWDPQRPACRCRTRRFSGPGTMVRVGDVRRAATTEATLAFLPGAAAETTAPADATCIIDAKDIARCAILTMNTERVFDRFILL